MLNKLGFALVAVMLFELVSLTQTPTAQAVYTAKPGDVIKVATGKTVYYVDDQLQRIPLSADGFTTRYNNNFAVVKNVTEAEVGSFNNGLILNRELSKPNGALIIYELGKTVYLLENGVKRPFTSWEAFAKRGYKANQIHWVGTYQIYATGAPIN